MMASDSIAYRELSTDYQRVEQAMVYLQSHYPEQPTLAQVAASVGLSEYHFQRLFTHWVGISPKRFLQYLTKEHARELLDHSASVLEAAYESGLSGPSRLHDLFVSCDAVTPGEYKMHGSGLEIQARWKGRRPGKKCLRVRTVWWPVLLPRLERGAGFRPWPC